MNLEDFYKLKRSLESEIEDLDDFITNQVSSGNESHYTIKCGYSEVDIHIDDYSIALLNKLKSELMQRLVDLKSKEYLINDFVKEIMEK